MGGTSMAKRKPKATELAPAEVIEQRIFLIRGKSVMLDSHLAELYGVRTAALNQAVQRNLDRFPEDFAFQLEHKEFEFFDVTNCDIKNRPGRSSQAPVGLQ